MYNKNNFNKNQYKNNFNSFKEDSKFLKDWRNSNTLNNSSTNFKKNNKSFPPKQISKINNKIIKKKESIDFSLLENKFICYIMRKGKKKLAESIWNKTIFLLKNQQNQNINEIMNKVLKALSPKMIPRSKASRSKKKFVEYTPKIKNTSQKYMVISKEKGNHIALRWLSESARKRKEKSMSEKLYKEILDVIEGKGFSIAKKEELYKKIFK